MNSCKNESSQQLNNNNFEMDKHTAASCYPKGLEERQKEDFQSFNDVPAEIEDADSDENAVNLSDSYDDLPVSDQTDDDDVQLSSPSNSLNSDVEQRWYAFRGRWGVVDNNQNDNNLRLDNQLPDNNQPAQQQDEEETDFLEMDFEPDTNSEIENQATLPNGPQNVPSLNQANSFNFHNPSLTLHLPQTEFRINNLPDPVLDIDGPDSKIFLRIENKNTGAKPKQLSTVNRPQKASKHVTDGDNVFKMCTISNNNNIDSICSSSSIFNCTKSQEVYNLGASSSRESHNGDHLYHDAEQNYKHDENSFMKIHKSPSKSSSHHHNHKQQRLHEEQNDQFLFEIEPIKPRNSATIYTTNCDEKILLDALLSLDLNPNREMVVSYFNRVKHSASSTSTANHCELNLVDYVIYKSKLNCNYLKLIELIQKACKIDNDESYGDKKFDVNFYPVSDCFKSKLLGDDN